MGVPMNLDRRTFAKSATAAAGAFLFRGTLSGSTALGQTPAQQPPNTPAPSTQPRVSSLSTPAIITKIRVYYPPNYNANGPQAFPQSNMLIFVDTDQGITGVGQGGSPDLIRNLARSVIGKNAFDTEAIWQ